MPSHPAKYEHILLPGQNPEGKHVLSVIAKTQYDIGLDGQCRPAELPVELVAVDRFFDDGDPLINACEVESDLIPWKPQTDVIIIGKAHAPRKKEVIRMSVTVQVGKQRKQLLVTGDRVCRFKPLVGPMFGEAQPFIEMELRYERAYGGVDIHSFGEPAVPYPRNPIGRGFVIKKKKEAIEGMLLPNIEDPTALLTPEILIVGDIKDWHRMPMPIGIGVFGKTWYPRSSFAGVMPADMPLYESMHEMAANQVEPDQVEKFKALKLPLLNFRFFNGASLGLALPYLTGDETVHLEGMAPDGSIDFQLPDGKPAITIDYGDGAQTPEVALHTVVLRVEEKLVEMVWRGACEYGGPEELEKITKLDVTVEAA